MSSVRGHGFTDTCGCPSSQNQVSSHYHELPHEPAAFLQWRLTDSEFCAAELSLLSAYTPTSTGCKPADMLSRRALAEPTMLGNCIPNRALRKSFDYEERKAMGFDVFEASRMFNYRSDQVPGGLQWHS